MKATFMIKLHHILQIVFEHVPYGKHLLTACYLIADENVVPKL